MRYRRQPGCLCAETGQARGRVSPPGFFFPGGRKYECGPRISNYLVALTGSTGKLRIMGIDPGTAITGYSVIGYTGGAFRVYEYGAVRTESGMALPARLGILHRSLADIISRHSPDHFAVEELFFNKNVKTALSVGHARGVSMLAAVQSGIPVYEYTPLQVKQAVVGHGRAAKEQVQFMVRALLGLRETPSPDDVADALAVAICHAFRWSGTEALRK